MIDWLGTPKEWQVEVDGPLPAHDRPKLYKVRNRAAKIRVEEPVMRLLDETMMRHGVSSKRLEAALGLGESRIKDMRRFSSAWEVMRIARQCLWLMGYDLRVAVVKVRPEDRAVVMTKKEKRARDLEKINGKREPWDPRKMWVWLGMDKLEKGD